MSGQGLEVKSLIPRTLKTWNPGPCRSGMPWFPLRAILSAQATFHTSFGANKEPHTHIYAHSICKINLNFMSTSILSLVWALALAWDLEICMLLLYIFNKYTLILVGDKGVTNAGFCFLSTCFLLTTLTSSASGSPGKHDLYDVGGYCNQPCVIDSYYLSEMSDTCSISLECHNFTFFAFVHSLVIRKAILKCSAQ